MKSRGFQLGLPLLSKELTELANRRRTYIIRTIYALLFLGFVGFIYIDLMSGLQNNPMAILGRGRDIFEAMIYLQFIAIYLFLPAISCSVITHEKERNSLGLLLITRLSPGTIILEKYLGRLITMLTFLTLGLPILAFAYALGGVSPAMFISGIWFLLMTMLQVAALGVLCSSFFRSTVGAFIATYVFGFFMLFGPIIVYELNLFYYRELFHVFSQVLQNIPALSNLLGNWGRSSELNLFLFGPYLFDLCSRTTGISAILGPLILSIPMLTVTLMFLIMAHYFLVRRAFLTPRNLLLNMFRKLDSQFSKINDNRVTRGIVLVQDDVKLPEDDPIAWRETSKKSLGTFRYLFRILVALEVPILFLCILIATGSPEPVVPGAVMLLWGVWILTTLLLAVSATSLIAGERSHETLDVLLTAPLSGREILRQKIAGVRRLCLVLLIPLLTIVLFETWWKMEYHLAGYSYSSYRHSNYSTRWFAYFTGSMLTISIYLPMLIYLFCWIGMKIKSQTKAILTALGGVILWCLSPFILAFPLFVLNPSMNEDSVIYGVLLGPASFIVVNEIAEFHEFGSIWIPLILNSLIYGCLCFWFRHLCLGHIDERLGRLGDTPEQDYVPPASPRESKPVLSSPLEG